MKTVRQVLAIARTEFRFAFRRGAPVAVTVLIGLLVGAGIAVAPLGSWSDMGTMSSSLTPEQVQTWTSFGLTMEQRTPFFQGMFTDMFVSSTMLAWLLILLALPLLAMATSVSIPADRKFGVSELLSSTPITGFRYLVGKFLGMVAVVLLVGAAMVALFFAVTESILFSTLHYGLPASVSLFLIKLTLLDGVPILVCGTAIGLLVGVFFRTRRAAIFPGMLAGGASLVCWIHAFRPPAQGNSLGMTDLAYYYLLQNYHSPAIALLFKIYGQDPDMYGLAAAPHVAIGQIALMYLTLIAGLAILAGLARLWLQWKENF